MTQYPKTSAWIMCLINECEAKGDPRGEKVQTLIERLLDRTRSAGMAIQLVLVENASTDNTLSVLRSIAEKHPDIISVISEPIQGKAIAERTGFRFVLDRSNVEAIVTLDADGEHDIDDMMALCATYCDAARPAFVVGSRFSKSGVRNKKDEILRSFLVFASKAKDTAVVDDPRCGGRVYDPQFIRDTIDQTVAENYGLQYELVARGLAAGVRMISHPLDRYEPQRSRVFRTDPHTDKATPELLDLCNVISSVFGSQHNSEEGKEALIRFGESQGNPQLFEELYSLFSKGKMTTDHGRLSHDGFMPDKAKSS